MNQVIALIPARFGSTRFPGKPLARDTGKFLIQHVCEQVRGCGRVQRCIVATDDERIAAAVRSFGGEAAMTRDDHVSGTDRIAEVCAAMGGHDDDIVLNVQGDEPELDPRALDKLVVAMLAAPEVPTGTLACAFPAGQDPGDANLVKVVRNMAGRALYFSRARIPYPRDSADDPDARPLLHVGVYAYRRQFLLEFAGWPASPLERVEKLEQLRVLERGAGMLVELVEHRANGIDTPEQYDDFVRRWHLKNRVAP